jgi:hypothetical protein
MKRGKMQVQENFLRRRTPYFAMYKLNDIIKTSGGPYFLECHSNHLLGNLEMSTARFDRYPGAAGKRFGYESLNSERSND